MNNLIVLDGDLICYSVGGWSLTRGVSLADPWCPHGIYVAPTPSHAQVHRENKSSLPFCYWEKTPEVSIAITNVADDNLTCAQIVVVYGFRARPRF